MAAVAASPVPPRLMRTDSDILNTLPDPRTPSPSSSISRSDSTTSQHPDLSDEVATLSSKLVKAINNQTNLDDALQATRHELELARAQIAQLEAAAKEHQELISTGELRRKEDVEKANEELISSGQLRRKEDVEKEVADMRKELAEEKERRKKMELEVNDLTTSLFTEANEMVVAARQEKEASDKRNEQLKNQINETETILQSQQEQLQDLKAVVEKLSSEKDEDESNARVSTAPSTPGIGPSDKMSRIFESANITPITPGVDDVPPDHPLKFSHLIHPILRYDLHAYRDFAELIKTARKNSSAPASRVSSGSFGSLNVLGLATGSNQSSHASSPATPNFPQNNGNNSPRDNTSNVPTLKDTKVYKRALAQDIEPTLRLDEAPGLSWLARRTVLNSMTTGSFSIEPMPPQMNKFRGPVFACSLCGENRKGDQYSRKHRFRTAETEEAQRYPLCDYCLGRVRSACDYISFLRLIRDGHWRAESDEEIKTAWEESVRLRERMFWQRVGGGVVPAYLQRDSPRSPTFPRTNDIGRNSDESTRETKPTTKEDPFNSINGAKRISIGKKILSQPGPQSPGENLEKSVQSLPDQEQKHSEEAAEQLHREMRDSTSSKSSGTETVTPGEEASKEGGTGSSTPAETPSKEVKRLSIAIPGSFD
jgi:Rab guanine nucleotide exchange factor SEC2